MTASCPVRRATEADRAWATGILADAFDADPAINHIIRQDAGRRRGLELFFGSALGLYLPLGEVYVAEARDAVALWAPPGEQVGAGLVPRLLELPRAISAAGWRGFGRMVRAATAADERHPRGEPHYYLFAIGVSPAAQGQGRGSALLREVLARCDAEGIPAYLEASHPRNRALYSRHGFCAREALELPDDGPPVWPMWREPAG